MSEKPITFFLIKWISDTCGFSVYSNFFVPVWESICSTLVYVSLYLPLSCRTSWISTGFKAFEDQPATLVDPCPSFCLCLASSSRSPLFRAFESFWNILSMLIRCGLLVTSAPPTTLRGTHGPLFGTPSLIRVHSPAGFGRHVSPGDLCGVIMYSLW